MKSKKWSPLREGDIVDVVAPGFATLPEELTGGVAFLKSWNLKPRVPKKLIQKHFLHSNEDEKRADFLVEALLASDSKAVWCLRGGYGSNRLLPYLAKMPKPKQVKLVVGISDVTSLHLFLAQAWGWPTLHGSLLDRLGKGIVPEKIEKELMDIVFGKREQVVFKNLKPLNAQARQVQTLHSRVTGGNLTVLQSTLATPWQLKTNKSLLFIEDLGERGYRLDRMMEHFRQAGVLKNCEGLLLGHFLGGYEPGTEKNNFNKVFQRWAQELQIPIWQGLEVGHGIKQRPLPLNTSCVMKQNSAGFSLTVQTGVGT